MKLKELLPILPRYSDNSGYNVDVNYISMISLWTNNKKVHVKNTYYDDILLDNAIEKLAGVLDCEVDSITAGKSMVGGEFDEMLQIWLSTEQYAEIRDKRKI